MGSRESKAQSRRYRIGPQLSTFDFRLLAFDCHVSLHAVRGVVLALALAPALALLAVPARAAIPVRRYFEPTDLELENPGVVELDLQLGFIRSQGPYRLVVPDFEADLGILPNLELDIDGALAIEGPQDAPFALDHVVADNLWVSVNLGLFALAHRAARLRLGGGGGGGPIAAARGRGGRLGGRGAAPARAPHARRAGRAHPGRALRPAGRADRQSARRDRGRLRPQVRPAAERRA